MKPFMIGLLALGGAGSAAWGNGRDNVRTFDSGTPLRFELRERTRLSSYWWPKTLLSYPVRFSGRVPAGSLGLRDADTKAPVPFQLSRVQSAGDSLEFAIVNFFSGLPSGGARNFELFTGKPAANASSIQGLKEKGTITLDGGGVKIRIPDSQSIVGDAVPGPITQISHSGKWFGTSRFVSPKRKVLSIATRLDESGPLFTAYRLTYTLEGGASYVALVRVIAGYDHVQLREDAKGLPAGEGLYWEASWTGFAPTHRHAPNHPFLTRTQDRRKRAFDQIPWERIDEGFVNTQHGVSPGISADGELPFRLGPYQPWGAYIILTSACFWDERTNQSIGVFIDRVEDWQDGEYAIWSASNTMQVRYFYRNGQLSWRWPIVTGTRSTGIAAYAHDKDIEAIDRLARGARAEKDEDGIAHSLRMFPASHTQFLQNRHGTLDLNVVKDWVLSSAEGLREPGRIFREGDIGSPGELLKAVLNSELSIGMMTSGTRQNSGFSPVPARKMYGSLTDGLHRMWPQLNERQRERLSAWYLMFSYVSAGEDWLPMQTMLAGHPNFLSDVKSVPGFAAFLFPSHPMAPEWADVFEKFIELDTRYHTRPAVSAWESHGGRWTENIGTYVWAFLRPTVRAEFALRTYFDGKNRIASPQIAQIADWALNALSAPFSGEDINRYRDDTGTIPRHFWGVVTKENGPRRLHPPQGAHSARRMPPRIMWYLGDALKNYQPLLSEGLMWASRPGDDDSEHMKELPDAWKIMYPREDNRGTNPHLESAKYTGYGITLRAARDTADETSLHLQQLDEGPNYRWGIAAEGGSGVIYYYAAGKSYSHNGREDVGDRPAHDTDFATSFGVWKDGRFKAVGRNVLERPLYSLGELQFAEILPRTGAGAYSWPEYQGRSVLMAGSDYFVLYDDVFNDAVSGRFSWMTHEAETLPNIQMVKGGTRDRQQPKRVQVQTDEVHGVWYDGLGDSMAVVSHKPGFKAERKPYGCTVATTGRIDHIFRDPDGIDYNSAGIAFRGKSGIIRQLGSSGFDMAVFQGTRIAAGGVDLTLGGKDLGFSIRFQQPEEAGGFYFGRQGGTVTIACTRCTSEAAFYIDGAKRTIRPVQGGLAVDLEPGHHRWQLTRGLPLPHAPVVLRTENSSGQALVVWTAVPGAERYRLEVSEDNAQTWRRAGETTDTRFSLEGLQNGRKYHVRLVALNAQQASAPGREYPVYAAASAPAHPDGLRLVIGEKTLSLTWGEVLGTSGYRLYRRVKGEKEFRLIYSGVERAFTDAASNLQKPFDRPGAAANALRGRPDYTIYEYAVAAASGNGEGARSAAVSTDPTSWVNWDPRPGEPFRRRFTYNTTNYLRLGAEEDHSRYYPK